MEVVLKKIDAEIEIQRDSYEQMKIKDDVRETEEKPVLRYEIPMDDVSLDGKILAPFKYTIAAPGKNFRKDLVLALNYWLKAPKHIENFISEIIYLIHNYSLMVDDIQDYSTLRRGQPCCHHIFGLPSTINATCFLIAYNARLILGLNDPNITTIHTEIGREVLRGQAMDIYWRDNFICPTEEEYKLMVIRKTGGLFFFVNNILQYYSKENIDTRRFLIALGLFFQINDDYQNLASDFFHDNKGYCEDISEGKFSFPIVHVVNKCPEKGKIILDILRQRTQDVELKRYCLSIIEKCGGLEYTRKVLMELKQTILEETETLGPNAHFNETIIQKVVKENI